VALLAACAEADAGRADSASVAALGLEPLPELAMPTSTSPRGVGGTQQRPERIDQARSSAIVTAAARVAPAVVSVNVVRREQRVALTWLEQFYMPRGSERLVQGFGSGFIVSSDGLVITNQHVTEGAEEIVVTGRDGTDYEAELLGQDPLTDIAVLRIDGDDLPLASLGRSSELVIGEWVVAIGNPYAYLLGNTEPTVTAGVVSAVGRDLIPSGENSGIYVDMIQTDAAINPGNSGGPLVNALGQVIGVNASIFSSTGGSVGIGFAIPIERAIRVAEELRRYGEVRRAWVGLEVAGADRLWAWKGSGGLEVTSVADGSPASRAGLTAGDIMVSAGQRQVRTFLDWEGVKLDVSPGDSVAVSYLRNGRQRRAVVVIEDLPTTRAERVSVLGDMELITVTEAIRQERGLESEQGALIYVIGEATQRATRLRPGDVVLQINQERISGAEQVTAFFRRIRGRRGWVRVWVERDRALRATEFYVR
jgi:serine protease Do